MGAPSTPKQHERHPDGERARHSVRRPRRFGALAADVHAPRRGVDARVVRADERVLYFEHRCLSGVEATKFTYALQRDARGFDGEHCERRERRGRRAAAPSFISALPPYTGTARGSNMLGGASQIVSMIRVKCNGK